MSGRVVFIGAGPGDPELITVKGARHLQKADVVLADRLASEAIVEAYAPQAQVILVGKQCRKGSSTPQETINELMVHHARAGKYVVRLKGGDVSLFSNILDELAILSETGIPYEIVPGITAALGAAAYAGIPLTARGLSTAVRLLTYYKKEIVADDYWMELAGTDDTLVFYMSAETLPLIVERLTFYGIDRAKHLAIVQQATTPAQHVATFDLYEYHQLQVKPKLASPSLVIIGNVVRLQESFAWMPNAVTGVDYFTPVTGKVIAKSAEAMTAALLTA
ncbi:MAG TPA: uroporphyrinogen-III C-methyltransferase [Flavisolibacter sp.]